MVGIRDPFSETTSYINQVMSVWCHAKSNHLHTQRPFLRRFCVAWPLCPEDVKRIDAFSLEFPSHSLAAVQTLNSKKIYSYLHNHIYIYTYIWYKKVCSMHFEWLFLFSLLCIKAGGLECPKAILQVFPQGGQQNWTTKCQHVAKVVHLCFSLFWGKGKCLVWKCFSNFKSATSHKRQVATRATKEILVQNAFAAPSAAKLNFFHSLSCCATWVLLGRICKHATHDWNEIWEYNHSWK